MASVCERVIVQLGSVASAHAVELVEVDLAAWRRGEIDWWRFDRLVDQQGQRGSVRLLVCCPPGVTAHQSVTAIWQVLLRCQRWAGRRNADSAMVIETALPRYRDLHPMDEPLAMADWAHALDTWQWILALRPDAGCAMQLAALLHDIERLTSEVKVRHEHLATDYRAYKRQHARAGAAVAREFLLEQCGASDRLADRAADLIAYSDREWETEPDPDRQLLADADALSFFALNAAGFVEYYGAEHTRRKVAFTLSRMSASARAWLQALRLPDEVHTILQEEPWSNP